ncbi:hypothetical protein [Staphylococcus pettenkoferi]|uniref:hypothetical protein n=1 Tax=Staphylococcus pettenkoferi TaxID=170573 RepID=UPI00398C5554
MKGLTKRFIKVLVLYVLSTLIPTLVTCKLDGKPFLKWTVRTLAGYGLFAYGLRLFSKFKK